MMKSLEDRVRDNSASAVETPIELQTYARIRHPLWQHIKHSPCVSFMLEDDDEIICEADESCTAGKPRHDLPCKPLIKHLAQIDVREDWGNYL
jgi:hypothetical protein